MGLFGKKKGLVGVDIGSSAVKAVELRVGGKSGEDFDLVVLGLEPLPPEAIVDGAIMDPGAVIDRSRGCSRTARSSGGGRDRGLGHSVIVKKISLPQMSAEELESRSTGRPSSTSPSTSRTWPSTIR